MLNIPSFPFVTVHVLPLNMDLFPCLLTGKPNLQEFVLEQTLEEEDFPPSDGGAVLFKRRKLVERMVDIFITKANKSARFSNYYFRHAAGTGKTVLLKLFGKELQQRGFVVFMLTAPELDDYPSGYFKELSDAVARDGKQVALLVDEVQRNVYSKHWDSLLKKAPRNLLVIGAGISDLIHESPQFLDKFPSNDHPAIGHLTEEDMPEVLGHFIPSGTADPQWDLKTGALRELLTATGGQVYPFVVIAEHLLVPERVEHLSNVSAYLTSEAFYKCAACAMVRKRCFSFSGPNLEMLSRFLLEKPREPNDRDDASKSGLWTGSNFVSPLLVQHIFRNLVSSVSASSQITLDRTDKAPPLVEQIIAAGLADMRPLDFEETNYPTMDNNERGMAFRWGVCAGAALKEQVWLSSEVVTDQKKDKSGAKPTIDFVVNGNLNMGVELAKDRSFQAIMEKAKKIAKGGVYGQRHDSYIFHFVLNGTEQKAVEQLGKFPAEVQPRVYTYLRDYNRLLCGTKTVREGVVRRLASPPSAHPAAAGAGARQFSTLALGALRRLGRLL